MIKLILVIIQLILLLVETLGYKNDNFDLGFFCNIIIVIITFIVLTI